MTSECFLKEQLSSRVLLALDMFMQQRRSAIASQEPEMTLDEINAEIRTAREERRKKK